MALVAAVSLSGCGLLDQFTKTPTEPEIDAMTETPETSEAPTESAEAMAQKPDMTIDMSMFKFSPNLIEAEAGQTLTIKLTNSEGLHDLVIDELNVQSEQILAGKETLVTIEVPADLEPGTEYEFYCSVNSHRAQGMVGTFRVK